ncbi:alkaline phosphatase D family protein [Ohtaekwangia sp.]|uniref:alkaline phosphatase D family protein n=1 Tax=Ohtaekwangia sp. TaxID=2066019 RepID=UPI002F952E26
MKINHVFFLSIIVALTTGCTPKKTTDKKLHEPVADLFDVSLKPFYHGVASGDPLQDRVILWTRVTPDDSVSEISVRWEIASDENFSSIVKSDSLKTDPLRDYTVKVDVDGLQPNQHYYYRFHALGKTSQTGRTKTLSADALDSLKLAIVSCSNWEFGYFNAYNIIAGKEVDAVVHLGDYIYEYATGKYGDTTIGRIHLPKHEIISLQDYRTRYSQYHLDEGLRKVELRHPFITIWDDHEVANNVYTSGAQNHQPEEGDFNQRKAAAKQAYYEWLPIREGNKHYRSFTFGKLADLIMLDERLEGRTVQADSVTDPNFESDKRSMLGAEQLQWFENSLKNSKAAWKIIGNQVLFSDLDITGMYKNGMPKNLDAWDGYPAEKKRLEQFILQSKIENLIFVSGDTHASWAIETMMDNKDKSKKKQAIAVEFGTTSISSGNGNEGNPEDSVKAKEVKLMKLNPHVKYVNNRDHGYLLLTLYPQHAKAEWFYVETLRTIDNKEILGKKYTVEKDKYILQ